VVDEEVGPAALRKERPTCDRCGAYLRKGNIASLCDPCSETVASCVPYVETATPHAPPDVNFLELVAGIVLTHDALHPGEPLHVREALAAYGVDADHVKIQQAVAKLRRRHGLVMSGKPREPGYRVKDWWWVAKRVRSSVRHSRD
jgi:hypothetical protein